MMTCWTSSCEYFKQEKGGCIKPEFVEHPKDCHWTPYIEAMKKFVEENQDERQD